MFRGSQFFHVLLFHVHLVAFEGLRISGVFGRRWVELSLLGLLIAVGRIRWEFGVCWMFWFASGGSGFVARLHNSQIRVNSVTVL
jgi:hypothetical protein